MTAQRGNTRAAVAGLFAEPSATGGLAGRGEPATTQAPTDTGTRHASVAPVPTRVRLGVELTEHETDYLRSLSRPARTGGPRTLGSKFVATAVLTAAIELLVRVDVDMHGVAAGDLAEMTQRARDALIHAALRDDARGASR
jgi:hypothetical protein